MTTKSKRQSKSK